MGDLAAGKDLWDEFCSLIQTMAAKPTEFCGESLQQLKNVQTGCSIHKKLFYIPAYFLPVWQNFCPAVERSGTSISLFQDFLLSLRAKPDFLRTQKKVLTFYQLLNLLMLFLASFLKGFW